MLNSYALLLKKGALNDLEVVENRNKLDAYSRILPLRMRESLMNLFSLFENSALSKPRLISSFFEAIQNHEKFSPEQKEKAKGLFYSSNDSK